MILNEPVVVSVEVVSVVMIVVEVQSGQGGQTQCDVPVSSVLSAKHTNAL